MLNVAMAVFLAQAAAPAGEEPKDEISEHVKTNIHVQVRAADAAAVVTIASATAQTVKLRVDQTVQGTLPEELTVAARAFAKPDLEGGTRLLVFFRNKQPTGLYELVDEGKVRQYPLDTYLARTKWEMTQAVKAHVVPKRATTAAPAAPQPGQT